MNISSVFRKQLEEYERQMTEAAAVYAEASSAIRAISALANRLREEMENEADSDAGMEKEVSHGS